MLFSLCACSNSKSEQITCPVCEEEQSATASFCHNCGNKLGGTVNCGNCGTELKQGVKFCPECGNSIANSLNNSNNNANGTGNNYNQNNGYYDANTNNNSVSDDNDTTLDNNGATSDGNSSSSSDTVKEEGDSDCSICAYDGLDACKGHECVVCEGKGYIKCYGCTGGYTPYGPCISCVGGKIDCTCDDGIKYYDKPLFVPTNQETALCDECKAGYVQCPICEGTGRYGTIYVGGYNDSSPTEVEKVCYHCLGAKKVECDNCGGDGMVKPS